MKFIFTLSLYVLALSVFAQWSTTDNLFADSLHMPVSMAARIQSAPLVVRSYPDSGYFVIWQDTRNDPANYKTNIYAQKYDKNGVALWAVNGVPVATTTNNQHYTYGDQGQDYRNHSYAATDSAGGFYIGYSDDSVSTYVFERACVQHVRGDGSAVFPGVGYILRTSGAGNFNMSVQLIADSKGGFFVSYLVSSSGAAEQAFIYCYKDVNGNLQSFGGAQMNENAVQLDKTCTCGPYHDLTYPAAEIVNRQYNIFSDLQGGCNIVMNISVNGQPGPKLGYNRLWRAKKDATGKQHDYGDHYSDSVVLIPYQKDQVYPLYALRTYQQLHTCTNIQGDIITCQEYGLEHNGFVQYAGGPTVYDFNYPKGITVPTTGNINVSFLSTCERSYSQANGIGIPLIRGIAIVEEIFDSIPYQVTDNQAPGAPYGVLSPSFNKLGLFADTLLGMSTYNVDFSLSGGSNQIYAAGLMYDNSITDGSRYVKLQHLAVERMSADSFAVVYKTNAKTGSVLGVDHGDPFYGSAQYDLPLIDVNKNGNALFHIRERSGAPYVVKVSPIFSGAELAWGAMGRAIGTGVLNNNYYDMADPAVSLDPVNGTAVVAWEDTRNNSTTSTDIYMTHLVSLNDGNYQPPYKRLRTVPNPYGPVNSSQTLFGTSGRLTSFEFYSAYGSDPGVSPAVDISDNYNLGNVAVSVYENTGAIRTNNGKPYLDRSYTITPEHNPNGAATITVRLFFTTGEFDKLKAADPTITDPGKLAVIKQPGTGSGSTYSIVAGEETIIPVSWAAVTGGYYIEFMVSSFSNFFIIKNENSALPLTWIGVQASRQNSGSAKISWQVAEQQNVKEYIVQHSTAGIDFADACSIAATNQEQYSCIAIAGSGKNYYRVLEIDHDGKKSFSKTVSLEPAGQPVVTLYPNPAKEVLHIEGIQHFSFLQVINMQGMVILQQSITAGSQPINVSGLSKGSYLLKLTSATEVQTIRFSKQ